MGTLRDIFACLIVCEFLLSTFSKCYGAYTESKMVGENVELQCASNRDGQLFQFWQTPFGDMIAPGRNVSRQKYKYDVLTGDLKIHRLQHYENGKYYCYCRNIKSGKFNYSTIYLVVKEKWDYLYENDYTTNTWRSIVVFVMTILVLTAWIALGLHHDYRRLYEEDDDEVEKGGPVEIELKTHSVHFSNQNVSD